MTKYVALLRGIAPMNPNMRNERLRGVFEELGFTKVQTVISSGNVLFESDNKNSRALEDLIEKTLPERLDFFSTTIIRSQEQLQQLVAKEPFKGLEHTKQTNLTVTFLKNKPSEARGLQHESPDKGYRVVGLHDRAVCSIVDLNNAKSTQLMTWLEKEFGKEITTRTWKTVQRILAKWD